jgi:predicted nucleic acid-binding protein
MKTVVLLDSGPLGLVTNPGGSVEADACNRWLISLISSGTQVKIPEIADYEVRRELLRADKIKGIKRLDDLKLILDYVPLTTQTMVRAAELWAQIRKQGKPTADAKALDGDVILAAQADLIAHTGYTVVVATTNVRHLSRLVPSFQWKEI